ncbi:GPI ethanolamine phosphate transferase 2-like isoform X2 [Daphnia pulex]|nr:GPI ethanolamine phosphate transferase 2-like isoform X2 [Daphnia pulex]
MVFYGDDTWLKLFPGKFLRSEGTTSFFVNDFKEVDDNVTRHLDFELSQTDWSVMILHYLGLDHIGHVSGPRSPLIPQKLKEMDEVIRKIHQQFSTNDTAIIICGDHGMSDSGSHGGSSKSEVEIPLTFVMEGCQPDPESDSDFSNHLQIDLAPTMAVLMGVPIPTNNLGSLLLGVTHDFELKHKLYAAYVNARNIFLQSERNNENVEFQRAVKLYQDWLTNDASGKGDYIANLFVKAAAEMSSLSIKNLVEFDLYLMIVGIVISFQLLLITVLECHRFTDWSTIRPVYSLIIGISLFSIFLHVLNCMSIDNESSICINGRVPAIYCLGLSICIICFFVINCQLIWNRSWFRFKKLGCAPEVFLLLGSLLHAFSLGASSFVEEEHQTYYYFVNTLALLMIFGSKRRKESALSLIGFMGLVRIARCWNQTGDKWINEPDVKEWLNTPGNQPYLTVSSVIGAMGILHWIHSNLKLRTLQVMATFASLVANLSHRSALGFFSLYYPQSTGLVEASVAYLSVIVIGVFSRERSSTLITMWTVLTSLLKRPHNLILTWIHLLQYSLISPHLTAQLNPFYNNLAHYWIGMAWYFQEGNGNNLARIDLASGYVGLSSYNVFAVGFLLSCATFSGPVLALLLDIHRQKLHSKDNTQMYGFIYSRMLIMAFLFVIVTSLRYHLFVWTVFSPKLLYEGTMSIFLLVILILAR